MTSPLVFSSLPRPLASGLAPEIYSSEKRPLAIELFAGSMGWGRGLAAAGWRVIGFDIEHLPHHGKPPEHCSIALQDVLTLHGSQFKNASLIVASPPCQNYSSLAMPFSRSQDIVRPCGDGWEVLNSRARKEMRERWKREGPDNTLFDACEKIRREAEEASGRRIPLVIENVQGAREWVGPHKARYRSFYLFGDVGMVGNRIVANGHQLRVNSKGIKNNGGSWFNIANNTESGRGRNPVNIERHRSGINGLENDRPTQSDGTGGTSWFGAGKRSDPRDVRRSETGEYEMPSGTKIGGDWFSDPNSTCRRHGSRSNARKAASAAIAVIPFELAEFIGKAFFPK